MASYWQKYGLANDPFVDEGLDIEPFFPTRWHQQLDLLCHLARNSNMVLLVTGLSGMGKTTFMDILFDQFDARSGVCKVHGSNGISADILQELIIRHIGISTTSSPENNFQQRFLQQIGRMAQANDDFYLVIDDAHKLPKSSLAFLVDIAECQSSTIHPLHLILFGGPQLDAMMAEITAQHLGEAMTHTIRIEPFSFEMTKEYIYHRLTQAGFQGELPLSDLQLNQIHQASNGIPAKINLIARQALLDNDPKNTKRKPINPMPSQKATTQGAGAKAGKNNNSNMPPRFNSKKTAKPSFSKWLLVGSLGVVGIILFMVFYFRSPAMPASQQLITALPKQQQAQMAAAPNAVPAPIQADMDEDQAQTEGLNGMVATAKNLPAQADSNNQTDSNNIAVDDTADNNAASSPALITANTNPASTADNQADTPQIAANDSQAASVKTSQLSTASASIPSAPAPDTSDSTPSDWVPLNSAQAKTVPTPAAAKLEPQEVAVTPIARAPAPALATKPRAAMVATASLSSDEQALMQADPARLTIQIAAANNYAGLKGYIKSTGLNGQVYYFRTLNNGYPWYVAVLGDYVDAVEAKKAMQQLPSTLTNKEQPWLRSFSSVQKAIKLTE